ncbi:MULTISPECIES: hypothetical protein [Chitinophagaceae]
MKKKNLWMLAAGALLTIGMISCSSDSKYTPTPVPKAYLFLGRSGGWQISSVVFKKSDGVTDSLNYTSADSLGTSRIGFSVAGYNGYSYNIFTFADKVDPSLAGPKKDTTLFRYGNGIWGFDNSWATVTNSGNMNAMPDSLNFQPTNNIITEATGPVVRASLKLDSLSMQITYLDSTITNTTTNTKYKIMKVVSFVPASN